MKKNIKNLLAAFVIFALLPLADSAHAQVTVYQHGKKVQVAKTASKTWSNTKNGVTKESHRVSSAATRGWHGLTRGVSNGYNSTTNFPDRIGNAATRGWNDMSRGVSNGYNGTSQTTYRSTYQPMTRSNVRTYYGTSNTTMYPYGTNPKMMSMRQRAEFARQERLTRERIAREHQMERYHAHIAHQR